MMIEKASTRTIGREHIKNSVSPEEWLQNDAFVGELKEIIAAHRMMRHPIIPALQEGKLSAEAVKYFHLEFYFSFAQVFTDAIITAMATASELESRLGPMGKVSARFLLQLNLLDELGFEPSVDCNGEYKGDPTKAHYVEFHKVLKQLGITKDDLKDEKAGVIALKGKATYLNTFGDYLMTVGLLAAAESVFVAFAGPWSRSVAQATSIDTTAGYHSIHVADEHGSFLDDDHSEDTWYLVRQALTRERMPELKSQLQYWLDTWSEYLDYQYDAVMRLSAPQADKAIVAG